MRSRMATNPRRERAAECEPADGERGERSGTGTAQRGRCGGVPGEEGGEGWPVDGRFVAVGEEGGDWRERREGAIEQTHMAVVPAGNMLLTKGSL